MTKMRTAAEVREATPNCADYARANTFLRRMARYKYISTQDRCEMKRLALAGRLDEANTMLEVEVRRRQEGGTG